MLRPATKFLRRAPRLHRINRFRLLHHHALEEIALQRPIRLTQPRVKCQGIGVIFDAQIWREEDRVDWGGRVVDCAGPENRKCEMDSFGQDWSHLPKLWRILTAIFHV